MSPEIDDDLVKKFKARVEKELGEGGAAKVPEEEKRVYSREYKQFRKEYIPRHMSVYEQLCNISGGILKLKPDPKKAKELQEAIDTCHLNITPTGAMSFSILGPIVFALVSSLVFYMLLNSMFFVMFFLFAGFIMINPLGTLPMFLASTWRMKSGNQMVLCVFYIVTFMRHTSNLELAIGFASDHLAPPLSLDLKKVMWDVETQKYESVKESLEGYLNTWKKWNIEFIETFHLIEGSLFESAEERRLELLDKSLDVILEETYEKMLHYAQNLKSPLTMLNMLGIVLPILGLVILPLLVSFMEDVKWYNISLLYNVALPVSVYYLGRKILATRPTGYGDVDITELNPSLKKFKNVLMKFGKSEIAINPLYISVIFAGVFFMIGISPFLLHAVGFPDFGWGEEDEFSVCERQFCFLEYKDIEGEERGPFGLGASMMSLAVTISIGVGIGMYYKFRSQNVIKIREKAKQLENEFASALFQLGNRLGDGLPAEMAFGSVAETMEGSISGKFMEIVSINIRSLGMGVEEAIFDPDRGALSKYPSSIIESSMKVLTQSVKKGPRVAAQALLNVSRYIKEIHKVDERLKDLLSDVVGSMNSQIKFLTPAISGIVIGITSMITSILGKLGSQLDTLTADSGPAAAGAAGGGMLDMFGAGIPTFYFQVVVGLYVVQLIYILTIIANGIENGADKLNERFALGVNMVKSTIMFCMISGAVMFLFNLIAANIMSATT
ncbi:hypothetical protein KY361_00010 [Candidatus Woesearchaeota archaeon]|nr:hypothetical protein [Candidatus Woesearchaeota archaeon]